MTDRSYEQLSALLDDAVLDAREREQHLDSLLSDTEAQHAWGRYALIGRIMKNEATSATPVDISASIAAQVAQEPQPSNVVQGRFGKGRQMVQRLLKPTGSVAIAASVALVAVLTVQQTQPVMPEESVEPAFVTNPLGGRSPVSYNTVLESNEPTQAEIAQQRRLLQFYLLDHNSQRQLSLQAQQLNEQAQQQAPEDEPTQEQRLSNDN
ncbi:sigma-E factor negative regulatory protein [Pseudidiomarina homiensis]|uniref:Anti-sigma-E factor RseA n=1 Tax=Pseudidiomarina homiensis TaxID=364198 RepID=A0A432Y4F0_9GAMM|nr:RseA family anti-sigma factor [Pseudidiomarina homiensis]RUO55817.1 negative regulator of sigma E activity [Pseudidiomarina homiensis]